MQLHAQEINELQISWFKRRISVRMDKTSPQSTGFCLLLGPLPKIRNQLITRPIAINRVFQAIRDGPTDQPTNQQTNQPTKRFIELRARKQTIEFYFAP